jgi:hypothetical protein
MSLAAIKERIDSEIEGIESSTLGCHFRPYLLDVPQLVELKDHNGRMWPVWVVLQEPNGYSVIFDPEENE